jgi:phosphatidylserine decarboxylase
VNNSPAAPLIGRVFQHDGLNFLLTNRIPRALATHFMGWFSKVRQPVVRDLSIGLWKLFTNLDLEEAAQTRFATLHDCFIRALKDGARPIDPDPAVLTSPCDAIVGACGGIAGDQLIQAKGFTYTLQDLLADPELERLYRDGHYVTLRLTSSMYHRFHAPYDCRVEQVTYISGDTWNTNPSAVNRVQKLYCKNERAVLRARLRGAVGPGAGQLITLVPVASILVASIRLHFLDVLLHLKYGGPSVIPCDASLRKGEEMGWFELGSTIIVFAEHGTALCEEVRPGTVIRMGQPLLRLAQS